MRAKRRFGPAVAALTILGLLTSAPDAIAAGKKSPMIVVLDRDADVDAAVKRGKRDHDVKPTNVFRHAARGYAAELTPGQVRAIERDRSVMGVIPDSVVELVAQVTPPGVRRVDVETAARSCGTTGFVVHTVPFALFCLLRFGDKPMKAPTTATDLG